MTLGVQILPSKMKTLLAVIFLIGAASAAVLHRNPLIDKIIGGYVVEKAAHKYQVHLQLTVDFYGMFSQTSWACGGSIISPKWILTAAHCVHNMDGKILPADKIKVRTGQHDSSLLEDHARTYDVLRIVSHELYGRGYFNDIALLELKEEIQFNDHTAIVPLSGNGYTPADGSSLFVSGWGHTAWQGSASQLLRAVEVNIVNKAKCSTQYFGQIKPGMMCAAGEGKDSCQGDSGGPLVEVDASGVQRQVGIVSWGNQCADPKFPGVYANVGVYFQWIQQNSGLTLE